MTVKTYYGSQPEETGFYPAPDGVVVRFRENITETEDGWCADEYSIVLKCKEALARRRVEANRALFLAQAKTEAAAAAIGDLAVTVKDLTNAVLEISEMIAEQEDALVELAELIGG